MSCVCSIFCVLHMYLGCGSYTCTMMIVGIDILSSFVWVLTCQWCPDLYVSNCFISAMLVCFVWVLLDHLAVRDSLACFVAISSSDM